MNLLLLLSALLSALTGIGGGVRSPAVAQAVAGPVAAGAVVAVRRLVSTRRPANAAPPALRVTVAGAAWTIAPCQPIWMARCRD